MQLIVLILMTSDVKIVLWNVRGLNDQFKWASVFQYLKPLKPHVVLLQETHLDGSKIFAPADLGCSMHCMSPILPWLVEFQFLLTNLFPALYI